MSYSITYEESDIALIATIRKELGPTSASLTDHDIFRFLVARSRNVSKTVERLERYLPWTVAKLEENNTLTPSNIRELHDPNEPIYTAHLPHSNLGHTKTGTPIYWEKTGFISSSFNTVKKHLSADDLTTRHVRQQEVMFRDRCPKASEFYGRNIYKQAIVFDMKGLSYALDTTALSVFKRTLVIDEAFYPERLEILIMINAPWFFTSIWNMMRSWVDPHTATKIMIVGSDYLPHLLERIDISQIPEELGGQRSNFGWSVPENVEVSVELMGKAVGGKIHSKAADVIPAKKAEQASNISVAVKVQHDSPPPSPKPAPATNHSRTPQVVVPATGESQSNAGVISSAQLMNHRPTEELNMTKPSPSAKAKETVFVTIVPEKGDSELHPGIVCLVAVVVVVVLANAAVSALSGIVQCV